MNFISLISDDRGEGIQMKVVFKRVIMNEVLTTYLPTALLIIISYSTTFFSAGYFEANLSVNLSVMFVMTTLFVSVMEKLPQTSYIRMVDIWLIYGQLFPFLQVVLVTLQERCINNEGLNDTRKNQEEQVRFLHESNTLQFIILLAIKVRDDAGFSSLTVGNGIKFHSS